MVLPLIIGAAVIIGGFVLLSNSNVGEGLNRLTKGEKRKELEVDIERYNHEKDKRGIGNNIYAFLFGETALSNTYQQKNAPQPVNTGQQKQTPAQSRFNNYATNKLTGRRQRGTRYSDT